MEYRLGTNIPTVGTFGGNKTGNLGKHSETVYLNAIKDRTNLLRIKDSRDSTGVNIQDVVTQKVPEQMVNSFQLFQGDKVLESQVIMACLLYTSDAADDGRSVDLGGRRIIKKKIF